MANRSLELLAAAKVFISSSSEPEALVLRERLVEIVRQINADLDAAGRLLVLKLVQWDAVTPTQIPDSTMTEKFATMATQAHAVVALLVRELRKGTEAELEAVRVLDPDLVPLHALVFPPGDDWNALEEGLRDYLNVHAQHLQYRNLGDHDMPRAQEGLRSTMNQIAFRCLDNPSDVRATIGYTEVRG